VAEPATSFPVLVLPAELRHQEAPVWIERVSRVGRPQGPVRINCAAVERFDSSALAVLLAALRAAQAAGVAFECLNPPPKLRQLAALYGIDSLIFEPAVQ